ncbi:MAG: hypothetical protein OXE78_09745, partial [Gammaproteobacteria bacterium]|nr:hypothetical protein [Gammaproteobacteria bacterium]
VHEGAGVNWPGPGGSSDRRGSEDVRDAFTGMGPKDKRRDWVVIDVLGELGMEALELSLMQSGASPREIARLYRKHPQEITWTVVWVLNQWSDHGQRELPFALDKLAAVDGDLYDEYFF